jgi:hemoglobin
MSNSPRRELANADDVRALVDTFYGKVQADPVLGPIFNDTARVDWNHHLPVMYRFWESLLFGTGGYSGNPYLKHVVLPVGTEHFERWLDFFLGTVDELFVGEKAEEAKTRARMIADVFQRRMGLIGTKDLMV